MATSTNSWGRRWVRQSWKSAGITLRWARSPVEPKSVEAFILSAVDDLDAKLHQVRSALGEGAVETEVTGWHRRFGRVLYRGVRES